MSYFIEIKALTFYCALRALIRDWGASEVLRSFDALMLSWVSVSARARSLGRSIDTSSPSSIGVDSQLDTLIHTCKPLARTMFASSLQTGARIDARGRSARSWPCRRRVFAEKLLHSLNINEWFIAIYLLLSTCFVCYCLNQFTIYPVFCCL